MPSSDGIAYHTPITLTGTTVVRPIVVPVSLLPHVGGALSELLFESNWFQPTGNATIEDVINEIFTIMEFFYEPFLVGCISHFVGNIPIGWLPLDGSSVDADDYPELAAVVPSGWVSGGSINLPDCRNSFLVGSGSTYSIGDTGGEAAHTLTIDEVPSHTHTYQPPAINLDVEGPGVPDAGATVLGPVTNTGATGGGNSHNNLPPYFAATIAIFAGR
jgi:microcystin-dependent protein